jgi:hypothetical protein
MIYRGRGEWVGCARASVERVACVCGGGRCVIDNMVWSPRCGSATVTFRDSAVGELNGGLLLARLQQLSDYSFYAAVIDGRGRCGNLRGRVKR